VNIRRVSPLVVVSLLLPCAAALGAEEPDTSRGDRMVAAYLQAETAKLREACLADVDSLEEWKTRRGEYRRQLFDMLGLNPLPERTELRPVVTGTVEEDEFVVEKIHFQSRPHLYVTANLYRPKKLKGKAPAILYVCGHGAVKKNGISYGNKVHYQHHGAWFARNGYVCLTIDTLQLGEIPGYHHGTYNLGRWWWINRGYTPAGVEAWNCIRALDYLQSRPEVDGERIGVTGRSGGGAYSWWIAALDERIKCAVPVAGITDLQNHVVDGCVEGHCDCMFMVNTFRWDYPLVAALVAPRPLLISNTDRDRIFPLDGVVRTHAKVRKIYELYGADEKLGLQITSGPHADTQELRIHAFRWLNRHLKDDESLVDKTAVKFFEPEQLRVFDDLPEDELNTKIAETFVPAAKTPAAPESPAEWNARRDAAREKLDQYVFRGWPSEPADLNVKEAFSAERDGIALAAYDFTSQHDVRLRLYVARPAGKKQPPELVVLNALDDDGWNEFLATMRPGFEKELKGETLPKADGESYRQMQKMFENFNWAMAYVAPRGVGPTAWNQDERKQTQIRRRFYLLGQTLDGMRAWDIRRAIQTLRALPDWKQTPLWLQSEGRMAGNALYASLYEPDIARLDLYQLPTSHREGPIYLNVSRFLTMPRTVAMAAERSRVVIYQDGEKGWEYPAGVVKNLGWDEKQLELRKLPGM
jgi:dienelactone hydrolase